jgi:hypothetical protein
MDIHELEQRLVQEGCNPNSMQLPALGWRQMLTASHMTVRNGACIIQSVGNISHPFLEAAVRMRRASFSFVT